GSGRDRAAGKKSLGPISEGYFVLAVAAPRQTIICEGPEDALAIWFAAHEDITAPDVRVVAMLGQRWAKAAETFPGAIFAADADSVDKAREAAASCSGWIVDPTPCKDVNELLIAEGAAALWQRVAHPVKAEAEPSAPAFVRVSDMAHRPVPPREWLVPDLIPGSTVTTMSGDGGVGKSLLALQLAICTSLGLPWAGRAIEPAPALMVTAEDDLDEVLAGRRVQLGWSAPQGPAISLPVARLICLMLLAGRAMLGMSGTLRVVLPAGEALPVAVIAEGAKVAATADQRRWLAGGPGPAPDSRQVEFALAGPAAAAAGARIELIEGEGQLALRASPV
ncbi:MAG: AAA family ATPase, partial [Proteobacteria bacterium]|nr:AAA family ATPase [Pseudomonadota bacterium]